MPLSVTSRRSVLQTMLAAGASSLLPAWAKAAPGAPASLSGEDITLTIGHASVRLDGRTGHAMAINGTVPGPLIRLKEGQQARIRVVNALQEDTSIHWHGLLVPFQMDGVPGVSFPGIKAGESFLYDFPREAGRDLLVSQPLRPPGVGRRLRPDRHRSSRS